MPLEAIPREVSGMVRNHVEGSPHRHSSFLVGRIVRGPGRTLRERRKATRAAETEDPEDAWTKLDFL